MMQAPKANCMRDGQLIIGLDARELVPGDLVKLEGGDCCPADMRIVKINSVAL